MRKKSKANVITAYSEELQAVRDVLDNSDSGGPDARKALSEWALISAFAALEELLLEIMTAALNRDNSAFEDATGLEFPEHLNVAVCRFLIVGEGYFGFRDIDDLKKKLARYLGSSHTLIAELKGAQPAAAFEIIAKSRNLAAHRSEWAVAALKASLKKRDITGGSGLTSAGSWLCSIDNSDAWKGVFKGPKGKSRMEAILGYLESFGATVDQKVQF